jgi:hypothetical protein
MPCHAGKRLLALMPKKAYRVDFFNASNSLCRFSRGGGASFHLNSL